MINHGDANAIVILDRISQAFGIGDEVSQIPSSASKLSIMVTSHPPFFESYDSNCFSRSL